jgi:protoporphyrinogen oxidase
MIPAAAASFTWARIRMFAGDPVEDGSFETWIRNRFGGVLFKEYFRDYPQKVWGLDAKEIDRIVGDKRIPVIGLTELLRSAILGRQMRIDHPEFNYTMKRGVGEICETLETECRERGAVIMTESEPAAIRTAESRITSVQLADGRTIPCDYVLSTIPIRNLSRLFQSAPDDVSSAADELEYRSSLLVFLTVSRATNWPASMIYFSDPRIPFSRVSDSGQLSPTMVPTGTTMLCLEAPCRFDDAIWTRSSEALVADAVEILAATGLMSKESITGGFVERVSHSYPLFRAGFRDRLRLVENHVRRFPGLVTFGRQGGFTYINVDEALDAGFRAASAVLMTISTGGTCADWFRSTR